MQYLLTGSTGLIGRHILFELLKKIIDKREESSIWLIVRPKGSLSARQRIEEILSDTESPFYIQEYPLETLMSKINFIESHLNSAQLKSEIDKIESNDLIVIHNAASTNLMPGEAAEKDIQENNHQATINLLKSIPKTKIQRFSFVSTAFACGMQSGMGTIPHDYQKIKKSEFRNPYEKYKSETEDLLVQHCKNAGINLQILRPAVVCGRLIDAPFYCTTKFDVFYGWAKFFYKIKNKLGDQAVRIHVNNNSTLNIVPVDYVAKVICSAVHNKEISAMNIVNDASPTNKAIMSSMLESLGIKNYSFTENQPHDLNMVEKLYYGTAGKALGPYVTTDNQNFDTQELNEQFRDLSYSDVLSRFDKLIDYAITKRFV